MLSVIILSYNTKEKTRKCLESLQRSNYKDMEIIVVDNASTDGSKEMVAREFSKVTLVKNDENVGFAIGNNQAMKMAKREYFFLLNSDAYVFEDTVGQLVKLMQENVADVVGCRLMNPDGTWQASWGFFPTLRRITQLLLFIDNVPGLKEVVDSIHVRSFNRYTQDKDVDWVMGSCVMLKRDVWEKVGGFDEKFFMYGEEVEWMYRIKKSGFRIRYVSSVYCIHVQGGSSPDRAPAIIGEMKGWLYWFSKHNPSWQTKLLPYVILMGCAMRIVVKPAYRSYYKAALKEMWTRIAQTINNS